MTARTNNNPDFYRHVLAEEAGRERTVIYSTLDLLDVGPQLTSLTSEQIEKWDLEQIDTSRDITIHALNLMLFDTLRSAGGDIQIYCKRLIIPKSADDQLPPTAIDASAGPLPLSHGSPFVPEAAKDGERGASGDAIATSLQHAEGVFTDPAAARSFSHIGTAGDRGGTITIVCDELVLDSELVLRANGGEGRAGSNGQRGGGAIATRDNGGSGGDAGRGGPGGAGGTIHIAWRVCETPERLHVEVTGGAAGKNGVPGAGGTPFADSGAEAGPTTPGDEGEHVPEQITSGAIGTRFDELFLLKLVQKAKHTYLFNQPTKFGPSVSFPPSWKELGAILGWLRDVLASYAASKEGAPIADQRKHALSIAATTLAARHGDSQTFDGRSADWVSPLAVDKMFEEYAASSTSRRTLETRFLALNAAMDKAIDKQHALDEARASATAAKDGFAEDYQLLRDMLVTEIPAKIDAANARCNAAKDETARALEALKGAILAKFHCSLDAILRALESMAFTVADPEMAGGMAAVQVATLVNSGLTEIETNDGVVIKKEHVVTAIEKASGDLQDAARDALFKKNADGNYEMRPEKKLLLAKLDEVEDQIKNLSKTLGKEVTSPAIVALDAFSAAIRDKGDASLEFQLVAMKLVEVYRAYKDADSRATDLARAEDPKSSYAAATVGYFASLYQAELEVTMGAVAELQRKVLEATLEAPPHIDLATDLTSLWKTGTPPDQEDMERLDTAVRKLKTRITDAAASASSAFAAIPSQPEMRSELFVHVSSGPLLDKLRTFDKKKGVYTVAFTTVPDDAKPASQTEVPIENSRDYYDIRAMRVEARVFGAKTRGGNISVHINQSARAGIRDKHLAMHTFYRETPRETKVTHPIASKPGLLRDDDCGTSVGGVLTDKYLDAAGVYGRWTIRLYPSDLVEEINYELDLSQITGFALYFSGLARATSASVASPIRK